MPELASIQSIKRETPTVRTFTIGLKNGRRFGCRPGQFVEMSLFGCGEFPVSVSKVVDPGRGRFEVAVRRVGKVTGRLLELSVGATVGIRGPFGNGFPLEKMMGMDVLLIAGGVGLSPLKSLVDYLLANREAFGKLKLLYGSVSPEELLFKDVLSSLNGKQGKGKGIEVLLTVDEPDETWKGNVGVVTELLGKTELDPTNTNAVICGPSVMMKFAAERLIDLGLGEERLFLSFERRMQCGMGMCGHCTIGHKRVCLDGPVFAFKDIKSVMERLF